MTGHDGAEQGGQHERNLQFSINAEFKISTSLTNESFVFKNDSF